MQQSHVSAAARINARQATSTRVAFSDDEDADQTKAASSWQPKGKLVTPAKPKVNPVPSTFRGPKGSMPWSDAVCIRFTLCFEFVCLCNSFAGLQEVNLLVRAIKEFGFGSWAKMKSKYKFSNPDRSEIQLKDKARNLVKTGKYTVSFSAYSAVSLIVHEYLLQFPDNGKKSGRGATNESEFDL